MRKGQANPKLAEINRSLEHRGAVSEAFKGQHHSPLTEFKKGNIPPFKGKHIPLEIREKIRAANIGKHHTEETKGGWEKGNIC